MNEERLLSLREKIETESVEKTTHWSISELVSQKEARQLQKSLNYDPEEFGFFNFKQTNNPPVTKWCSRT